MESLLAPKTANEPRLGRIDIVIGRTPIEDQRPGRATQYAKSVLTYVAVVVVCLGVTAWRLKLWRADPTIPFTYGGDGFLHQLWAKAVIEQGWYLHNDSLGMPFGMDSHDYPQSESLHLLLMKLLALVKPDYAF